MELIHAFVHMCVHTQILMYIRTYVNSTLVIHSSTYIYIMYVAFGYGVLHLQ